MANAPAQRNGIVDVACFGETGLIATQRDREGAILPLPYAADIHRSKAGTLAMLASGTPCESFPPGGPASPLDGCDGLIDTGFPCHVDAERGTLSITGAPPGLAMIGSYAFSRSGVDETLGEAAPEASVIVVPDLLLGDRFAGNAPDAARVQAELEERGFNPLIVQGFRSREAGSSQIWTLSLRQN
jgi:hypothetical protein